MKSSKALLNLENCGFYTKMFFSSKIDQEQIETMYLMSPQWFCMAGINGLADFPPSIKVRYFVLKMDLAFTNWHSVVKEMPDRQAWFCSLSLLLFFLTLGEITRGSVSERQSQNDRGKGVCNQSCTKDKRISDTVGHSTGGFAWQHRNSFLSGLKMFCWQL